MKNEIKFRLQDILEELHPELDFDAEKQLIDGGVLDSFDVVELVSELNLTFGIKINALHLTPENFNSREAMERLICKLQSGRTVK